MAQFDFQQVKWGQAKWDYFTPHNYAKCAQIRLLHVCVEIKDYSIAYFNCGDRSAALLQGGAHTCYIYLKGQETIALQSTTGNDWEETVDEEFWAMREKDPPSLVAGQFSSVCDAMMSHTDTIVSYVCIPAPDEACLG